MKLYPVMLNVAGRRAVVVGGGKVALRKIHDLLDCGAHVKVVSPEVLDPIRELKQAVPDRIEIIERAYSSGDLDGAAIAFSATNNALVNREVYAEAVQKNIFINSVDDPSNCSFYVPSSFNRGDLIVAVSTTGVSPSMAARIRRDIENTIPESITDTLYSLKRTRCLLMEDDEFKELSSERRGEILKRITGDDDLLGELVKCENDDALIAFISKNL